MLCTRQLDSSLCGSILPLAEFAAYCSVMHTCFALCAVAWLAAMQLGMCGVAKQQGQQLLPCSMGGRVRAAKGVVVSKERLTCCRKTRRRM